MKKVIAAATAVAALALSAVATAAQPIWGGKEYIGTTQTSGYTYLYTGSKSSHALLEFGHGYAGFGNWRTRNVCSKYFMFGIGREPEAAIKVTSAGTFQTIERNEFLPPTVHTSLQRVKIHITGRVEARQLGGAQIVGTFKVGHCATHTYSIVPTGGGGGPF